jgi:hypothetical protein
VTRVNTTDETLVKAPVRAHRWRRHIESGRAKSITDLAEQEGVTDAYVCRLLPLTCLAPDLVEAILDGLQPKGLGLAEMLGNGPLAWGEQRVKCGSWLFGDNKTRRKAHNLNAARSKYRSRAVSCVRSPGRTAAGASCPSTFPAAPR